MQKQYSLLMVVWLSGSTLAGAQSTPVQPASPPYPRVAGYFSVIHPILTLTAGETTPNFSPAYTVGFPTGINILKSDRIGFSFEITPFVRAENGRARVYTLLFHPGMMFRFPHYFTINARLAFETSGRFGVTPVFSKVIKRNKDSSYFVAVPLPVRLGNDAPASVGFGVQVGVGF